MINLVTVCLGLGAPLSVPGGIGGQPLGAQPTLGAGLGTTGGMFGSTGFNTTGLGTSGLGTGIGTGIGAGIGAGIGTGIHLSSLTN